jgi:hypothetical protein
MLGVLFSQAAVSAEAVNLILKNNGSSAVEVALIDQYGGNFSANIDAGMASNQTLKNASEIRANGSVVHVVSDADEGKEVLISH